MTDVLKIALDKRAELHEELAKLDDFIRMAETLIRNSTGKAPVLGEKSDDIPQRPSRVPGSMFNRTVDNANNSDSDNNNDSDESDDSRPQVIRRAPAVSAG